LIDLILDDELENCFKREAKYITLVRGKIKKNKKKKKK
jgi:hypothetical protein